MIDPGIEPGTCCEIPTIINDYRCKADVITATPIDQSTNNQFFHYLGIYENEKGFRVQPRICLAQGRRPLRNNTNHKSPLHHSASERSHILLFLIYYTVILL